MIQIVYNYYQHHAVLVTTLMFIITIIITDILDLSSNRHNLRCHSDYNVMGAASDLYRPCCWCCCRADASCCPQWGLRLAAQAARRSQTVRGRLDRPGQGAEEEESVERGRTMTDAAPASVARKPTHTQRHDVITFCSGQGNSSAPSTQSKAVLSSIGSA